MHLVLRSSQATGDCSFRKQPELIKQLVHKFAKKYGVKIYSMANVGNLLHFHIKLGNRFAYPAFIRALTGALAWAVTKGRALAKRFWDRRPYTRIVLGARAYARLRDYIAINQLEGCGWTRDQAVFFVQTNVSD